MPISAATNAKPEPRTTAHQAGFTLVEMLVALVLLSMVGLALVRFQTYQLAGASGANQMAAARLVADNIAVDVLAAPTTPTQARAGQSLNMGRVWHWTITPLAAPQLGSNAPLVQVQIQVRAANNGPVLAERDLLRPPTYTVGRTS